MALGKIDNRIMKEKCQKMNAREKILTISVMKKMLEKFSNKKILTISVMKKMLEKKS